MFLTFSMEYESYVIKLVLRLLSTCEKNLGGFSQFIIRHHVSSFDPDVVAVLSVGSVVQGAACCLVQTYNSRSALAILGAVIAAGRRRRI